MKIKRENVKTPRLLFLTVASAVILVACGGAAPAATVAPAATAAPAATTAAKPASATDVPKATASEPTAAPQLATAAANELVVAITGDAVKIDPAFTYDFTTSQVVNQVTEALLKFRDGSTVVPNLAESVENPDPLTWIYKIRKGVTFQDGSPMTADDVVFSMQRVKNPETASYTGWMYANVDKIEKVDDFTVKVTLKQIDAFWQYVPATTAAHVISKKHFEAAPKDKYGTPEYGALGTGPYKFVKWEAGNEITLEKNPNYWNKANGGPYLDKITLKILPEATTRVTGLQNGQIQFLLGGGAVPPDQLSVIQKMDNVKVELADSYYNDFLAFNTQHKPFDNVKVRQALNYAIDKKAVWKNAVGEFGLIGRAVPVAPRMWVFAKEKWAAAYEQLPAYDLDLAKAKALFAESGAKPEDLTGKVIVTDEDPVRMSQALALQAAAKELGADMEIKKITNQELNTTAFSAERDYDVLAIPWGSDFPDPAGNLMPVFHSRNVGAGGSNFANYKNEALDKVLDAQQSEPDNTKRADKMIEAEKIIAEETPWIVFGHQKQMLVINNGYEGYLPNPLWYWDPFLKDVKKK